MAWSQISSDFIQYQKDASGTSAVDYYLKCYAAGTSTPISIALDESGSTLVDKVRLDSEGFAENASGGSTALFIDQKFRLVLYINSTDADANTFANAVQDIDDIPQPVNADTITGEIASSKEFLKAFDTLNDAVVNTELVDGDTITWKERTTGNKGGAIGDVVLASTVTPNTYDVIQCTGVATLAIVLRFEGVVDINQYGAVPDWNGSTGTDNTGAIQAAMNKIKAGGKMIGRSGDYYITDTICPQYDGETPLQRYNDYIAGTPSSNVIADIEIELPCVTFHATTSTFAAAFPNAMLGFIDVERVNVRGLQLESDLNNKVADWFDPTNYFNVSEPAVKGVPAIRFYGFKDCKVSDYQIRHCNTGIVMADDTQNSPSLTDTMNTYRGDITRGYVYNTWQAYSISIGSMEELLIDHNHLEYTFVKLVQETDQGRAIKFVHNTGRDISGILTNTNQSSVSHNTFNNLLGGIRLQPQGGGNPDVTYDYDLFDMTIANNKCYSDHATTVTSGTAQPTQFLTIVANNTLTAGQTVTIENLKLLNNTGDLWPSAASTTAGAFIDTGGDASRVLKNSSIEGNEFTLRNGNGTIVSLPASGNKATFSYDGHNTFRNNSFERTTASANIEISFHAGSFNEDSVWTIDNNYIDSTSTNRQFSLESIGKLVASDNNFILGNPITTSTSVYFIINIPKLSIKRDKVRKFGASANRGYFIQLDGTTATTYDTDMNQAVWYVNENEMDIGQFIFGSQVTFPASSEALYDLTGNTILDNASPGFQVYPTITGFVTENVVNPYKGGGTPPVNGAVTPAGYLVTNLDTGGGQEIGWVFDGTWNSFGTK